MLSRVRPLVAPAVLTVIGMALLIALGVWQLHRLAWKEDLLARIEARIHAPPQPLPQEEDWPRLDSAAEEYRPVVVEGAFLHDKEVRVHSIAVLDPNGGAVLGYVVLTPLRRDDGSIVIVNRGFVPMDLRAPERRPEGQIAGKVRVTGLLRAPQERGWFVPDDQPEKGEWFTRDPVRITAAQRLSRVAPFLIDADASPVPGGWPRGGLTVVSFPNRHLEYALTWFGLAAAFAGVFLAWAWGRLRQPGP